MRKGESAHQMKNSQKEVAGTRMAETRAERWPITNNKGIQQGDSEKEDDDGVATTTSTPTLNAERPVTPADEKLEVVPPAIGSGLAAFPALVCYPVGRGISLPFGRSLPRCAFCNCNALIALRHRSKPESVLCLEHGLLGKSDTRDLFLLPPLCDWRYSFISPEHEAAIRAFVASPRCGT